jgi:multicomponent Na+:H+ antiporter subunit F
MAVSGFLQTVLLGAAAAFVLFAIVLVYRIVAGPTMQDRVVALNVVGTNAVIVIALLGAAFDSPSMFDVALVYALLNFLLSIAIAKFTMDRGEVL